MPVGNTAPPSHLLLAHVLDVLEAHDHLLAVGLQLGQLGPDAGQLLLRELAPPQGGHGGSGEGPEAGLPGVVVFFI